MLISLRVQHDADAVAIANIRKNDEIVSFIQILTRGSSDLSKTCTDQIIEK